VNDKTNRIKFEIDQLATIQRNHDLFVVRCALDYMASAGRLPFVHTTISANVPDALWVHLENVLFCIQQEIKNLFTTKSLKK
jgi:hypothetical protein